MSESLRAPRDLLPAGFDPALPFALLENSRAPAGGPASMLFWAPERAIVATHGDGVGAALDALDEARREGLFPCGYVAYEAGYVVAGGPKFTTHDAGRGAPPLVNMQVFARRTPLNRAAVDALLEALSGGAPCAVHDVRLSRDRTAYGADVERILDYIRAGDTYQVNYTLKARFAFAGPPTALYRELRRHQAVEFGALLSFPEARVLSLSPELFLRKRGTMLVSKPMKGTARRGATPQEDEAIRAALRADPKTISENLMIVDLIRNDLGRLAQSGTVTTRDLFEIQTFETVHQMVSTVEARVDRELPVGVALRHLLPCGSITGAPKVRTMEIIEELEAEPRGVYCGAIGHVAPDGDFAFNVPIRTVVSTVDGQGELGIGSGIVAEADAGAEFDECLLKARFLGAVNAAFQIIETMRLEPGAVFPERFDRHLARMAASASVFGFAFDPERVASAVRAMSGQPGRVRALLFHDGRVEVAAAPMASLEGAHSRRRVVWSAQRIESSSIFQRHKTTVRALYDRAFDEASAAGAYDVLFLNERGEVAEASRHNVFIERGGVLLTPPLASGALPGLARAALLESPTQPTKEAVLRVEDVLGANRVLLGNAVRGLVRVTAMAPPDDLRAPGPARREPPDPMLAHDHHGHGHDHDHGHADHGTMQGGRGRAFLVGIGLNLAFVVVEVIAGLLSHSMALLADAGHNFGDVLGLGLAWGATVLAGVKPSTRRTFGYRRTTIVASVANSLILLFVTGGLTWESIRRLLEPRPAAGATMIVVALVGTVINAASALLFLRDRKSDLNLGSAFLHLASDAVLSAGVAITGAIILVTHWYWLDPVVSIGLALAILAGTWSLMARSMNLMLDAVPEGIDPSAVKAFLGALPGVIEVHDLHIWAMSTTETALTAHVVMPAEAASGPTFLADVSRELHDMFGIEHATLQIDLAPAAGCVSCT